ncbi:MAG TPA: hypothetical protein VHN98_06840 [Acidimicrobiales bacterium]|nr:hypothetical protein [Acidimicrobiales bacterium]
MAPGSERRFKALLEDRPVATARSRADDSCRIVSARPHQTLLPAAQVVLDGADEALLAVAFVDTRGLHLIERELRTVPTIRLLATSQFDRGQSRTDAAMALAEGMRGDVRLFNPTGATTFHPKMYLARRGNTYSGVIGSANLTFGLVGNYETGVAVEGPAAHDAWQLGEALWSSPEAVAWEPKGPVRADELEARLYSLLAQRVEAGQTIDTLGPRLKANAYWRFLLRAVTVATARSPGGEHVEARMIQIAYDALLTAPNHRLSNPELLNALRVHRPSFVLALFGTAADGASGPVLADHARGRR